MVLLLQYTLIFASVLVLVALGGCFSEHSGVINIGLEGIMVMGALGGALAMKFLPETVPSVVMIIVTVVMAIVFGMIYSTLLGLACINFKADQTIVGTAMNMLGTAAGPHPFPTIVREFQKIIGEEAKKQILAFEHKLPDAVLACIGGGSNAIGMFTDFIGEKDVKLYGVEPAGLGADTPENGMKLENGKVGIFFGARTFNMQTDEGQINESYSISAGLDFPSVGPEHAYLKDIGRVSYVAATDLEALEAFMTLSMEEGIIPALESSHALAYALKLVRENPEKEQTLLVNLSGRGDKDIFQVSAYLEKAGFMKEGRIVPGMLEALRTRIAAAK